MVCWSALTWYGTWLQDDLKLAQSWYIDGRHYSLTLEAWLQRMDAHRKDIMPIMKVHEHA